MKFRSDISFLRALSVVMVMLFHFQVPGFSGGFIGVDVFFVISGFLMTQIILGSFDKDQFSLKQFYIKRIVRIIPPLQLVLWFVLIISVLFFFRADIGLSAKYVALSNFFVSNIYYWQYIDYFTSKDNILLHTWSLGVEWQFYLIYPILLLFLKTIYHNHYKKFIAIICFITFLSLVIMMLIMNKYSDFAFYMLPARFWELSIGAMAFFLSRKLILKDGAKYLIVIIAIFSIIVTNYYLTASSSWPSYYTLIPVVATVVILVLNVQTKLFSLWPIRFLGDISYSLYLWHWPWYILFKSFGFVDKFSYISLLVLVSVISASFSYFVIERRKIQLKYISLSVLLLTVCSVILFVKPTLLQSLSVYKNDKLSVVNYSVDYTNLYKKKQFNSCGCSETYDKFNFKDCLKIDKTKKNILLIGDSHMAQFSSDLRKEKKYNWLEVSTGYALPVIKSNGKDENNKLFQFAFKNFIPKNHNDIDLVIISAHWNSRHIQEINWTEEETLKYIQETIAVLDKNNINYLFLGQTESYTLSYPRIIMLQNLFGRQVEDFEVDGNKIFNNKLMRVIPQDRYVNMYKPNFVKHYDSGLKNLYMFDNNHLTHYGAQQYIDQLVMPRINKALQ